MALSPLASSSSRPTRRSMDSFSTIVLGSQLGCGARTKRSLTESSLFMRRQQTDSMRATDSTFLPLESNDSTAETLANVPELPMEVLARIFRYADYPTNFSLVCSRWNRVYRICFCYLDSSVAWVEGYRWSINFARRQSRRRDRERLLSGLTHRILEGLWMLLTEEQRAVKSLFLHDKVVQGVFIVACAEGRVDMARRLLEEDKRVDPGEDQDAALIEAACRGHEEVVKLLLEDPRVNLSALSTCNKHLQSEAIRWPFIRRLLRMQEPQAAEVAEEDDTVDDEEGED